MDRKLINDKKRDFSVTALHDNDFSTQSSAEKPARIIPKRGEYRVTGAKSRGEFLLEFGRIVWPKCPTYTLTGGMLM